MYGYGITVHFFKKLNRITVTNFGGRSFSFSSPGLGFPRLFTVTSEHIRFYFLVFLLYTFSCRFRAVD